MTAVIKQKKLIIGSVLGLFIIIIAGLAAWGLRSNNGTVTPVNTASSQPLPTYTTLNDSYIHFQYLSAYTIKSLPAQTPDLDLYTLSANTIYPKELAVLVQASNYHLMSGYILRASLPNTYHNSTIQVDGQSSIIWYKDDGSEETVFIPHGTLTAVLSFSIPAGEGGTTLSQEVSTLLSTFHWNK
jgi:hypothetical protein